jgi:tetratricopeptide (TPR) repeat protein
VAWLEAGLLVGQAKPAEALVVIERARARGDGMADIHRAALALTAARAQRALGRYEEAVAEADQAVELYEATGGDRLALLARRERRAGRRGAGDLGGAAAEAEDLVDRLPA